MKTLNILVTVMLSGVLFMQCENDRNKEADTSDAVTGNQNVVQLTVVQLKNAEISVGKPQLRTVDATIRINGTVDVSPASKVYVSNPFGGFVKRMEVLPGTKVKKGQLLVTMEDPQYIQLQQDYLMAKSRLKFLELDYKRQQDLNADKSISDKAFQQVSSEYSSQKVLVKSLDEKLRLINIHPDRLNEETLTRTINLYAPIGGYVSAVQASVGKYTNSTETLFELTDENALHASLTVFEKDLPYITIGQKLKITSPAQPGKHYIATVHTINRSVSQDRSSEIHCDFDKPDKNLFPGMFISADLSIEEAEVLTVPEDAVVTWANKHFIFQTKGQGEFEMIPVETGKASNGFIEIQDDIRNVQLVTRNAYSLLMQLKGGGED